MMARSTSGHHRREAANTIAPTNTRPSDANATNTNHRPTLSLTGPPRLRTSLHYCRRAPEDRGPTRTVAPGISPEPPPPGDRQGIEASTATGTTLAAASSAVGV